MPQKESQQRELLGAQVKRVTRPMSTMRCEVNCHVRVTQRSLEHSLAPSQEGANACEQLVECKRLAEVVVGARIQTSDAIGDGITRGQEQDRGGGTQPSILPEHVQAVFNRKPPVDDHQVPFTGLHALPAAFPVGGVLDSKPLLTQTSNNEIRKIRLVFD